jgi:hypothetical protein
MKVSARLQLATASITALLKLTILTMTYFRHAETDNFDHA